MRGRCAGIWPRNWERASVGPLSPASTRCWRWRSSRSLPTTPGRITSASRRRRKPRTSRPGPDAALLDPRQGVSGLQIDNLAAGDHRLRLGDGHWMYLDGLVFIRFVRRVGRRRVQPGRAKEKHLLVAVAGRWKQRAEAFDMAGREPWFLFAISKGGRFSGLARVDVAGGELPQIAADAVPELTNHHDPAIVHHRNQHDARRMSDRGDLVRLAGWRADGLDVHGKHAAFIDDRHESAP